MPSPTLVTGGGGQVGFDLQRELHRLGLAHVVLARAELDVTRREAIAEALARHRPGLLINLAAYTAVDRAEAEPEAAERVNAEAPGLLAEACAAAGVPLIHLSTDYVFDGRKGASYDEEDVPEPINVYGASKRRGELRVAAAWERHLILRTSWVFGVHGHNFVKTMLRLARERDALGVVADQFGCPTPARAIAAALARLAERLGREGELPWGTYHFAGAPLASWYDLAREALAAAGLTLPVRPLTSAEYPTPAPRPRHTGLDCTRFAATFGIPPADWRAGVREVVAELAAVAP